MTPLSNFVVVTPPDSEPLSHDEAVLHLRVDSDDDGSLIDDLIIAAREHVEKVTSRAFVTRTLDYYLDQFPGTRPYPKSDVIELPRSPLASVTNLQFTDTYGTVRTWTVSGSNMINDVGAVNAHIDTVNEPGRIVLAYSQIWPNQILRTANAVKIRFTAGYGEAAAVPQAAKSAMKMLIGTWYDNRESIINGRGITSIPVNDGVEMFLAPLKVWSFA